MTELASEPLTYSAYLHIPELLSLQSPLGAPEVHDELMFIIVQQAQELWFKQILHELRLVISLMESRAILEARRVLDRMNRMLRLLADEVEVMETIQQVEFQKFRHLLTPSSGFESGQFRQLEFASGLRDESYLKVLNRIMDVSALQQSWPKSLRTVLNEVLRDVDADPARTLVCVYSFPTQYPELYALLEALTEYELGFQGWRYHHLKLVERVIGDKSPGTGGSAGSGYLARTLNYRFFPELWEAHNQISAGSTSADQLR
jgi:tryptophan 2,3-dioxygenase